MKESGSHNFLNAFGHLCPKDGQGEQKLKEAIATLQYRNLDAGATILREGQVCASVPFVLYGSIRVFKRAETGREITLYRIEEGQACILSFGCSAGLGSFPASVVAEKATSAAFMPRETVRELFAHSAAFRDYILAQYSRRMAEVIELVEEIAFRKVDERLAQFLRERGAAEPSGRIEITHKELADQVGTSREVVSRILKDWEERGNLEISRGALTLLSGFEELLM